MEVDAGSSVWAMVAGGEDGPASGDVLSSSMSAILPMLLARTLMLRRGNRKVLLAQRK